MCNMLESELAQRCKSFVTDKGLDTDALRKIFYRLGVTTAIDVRRMWQEEAVDGLRHPTLYEGRVDAMFHDEVGKLYCKCPKIGKVRQMSYYGLESKRATQKFHCPMSGSGESCAGREECHRLGGFAKMQNGASYASRSTRTSIAPLRRCQSTPIDGSGCTRNAMHWSASTPGSVATFSWSATICEGLKPCRCGLP